MSAPYIARLGGQLDPSYGLPIISCRIATIDGIGEDYSKGGKSVRALVDTGATHVQVKQSFADEFKLASIGKCHTQNVGFSGEVDLFEVDLVLDMWRFGGAPFYLRTGRQMAMVSAFGDVWDIIMPMTTLRSFQMTFLPTGEFELLHLSPGT